MGRGRQVAGTLRQHKKGVLALMRSVFLSYSDVNWAQTQVYSLGNYGQLYVNLSGREPQGIVNPGDEYDQVIEDLVDRLNNLRNPRTGELIAVDIYHREDIYQGDHMTEGPDIVFLPKDMRYNGFGLYQFSSRSWLEPSFDRSGGHRMDGILMATGPGISRNTQLEDAALIDIAPTVLAAMDVPIPDDMDGKVLTDVFEEGYFTQHPIRYTKGSEQGIQEKVELSPEQEEEIKERLRGLGYLA